MALIERLGLIVNPIAGMGGKAALKGTDDPRAPALARARGVYPESGDKTRRALRALCRSAGQLQLLTVSGQMGQDICQEMGLPCQVVYQAGTQTGPEDTRAAAKALLDRGVELLLFAGGDGTARDICQAVGQNVPVLGIPAGVKIQSAVFALTPESAGALVAELIQGSPMSCIPREVVDLDEDAYRTGHISAALYGMMQVPYRPHRLQSMKESGFSQGPGQLEGIASYLEEHLEPDVTYAVGSGSTAKCILRRLGLPYELLGIDVLQNGTLLGRDVTEQQLWSFAQKGDMRIIVSPIGGQGFVFGRGNHQFSARVLAAVGREGITIVAPEDKLLSIRDHMLHTDCGNSKVDEALSGWYTVLCGYGRYHSLKCIGAQERSSASLEG